MLYFCENFLIRENRAGAAFSENDSFRGGEITSLSPFFDSSRRSFFGFKQKLLLTIFSSKLKSDQSLASDLPSTLKVSPSLPVTVLRRMMKFWPYPSFIE